MAVSIQADTPLATQLSSLVQLKLVDLEWSTGGLDDSALAEYIILMLTNGKTKEEIASELSNDLLSLGPEDQGATDFATWLFQQVEALSGSTGSDGQGSSGDQLLATQAIPTFTGDQLSGPHSGDTMVQDSEMGDAEDGAQGAKIPTGPKSMRNGGKQNGKRLMGQINRAMDRSSDSALHRVRNLGQERINSHNRQPPKGPRGNLGPGRFNNGVPTGPARGPSGNRAFGAAGNNMQMSQQQQVQLLQMMEQQAKIMSSIFTPQQQQMLMPGLNAPAINPNFRGNQQGKSLFDRVQRPGTNPPRQQNGAHIQSNKQDTDMADDTAMDVESAQGSELGPDTICKFNLKCTKADCIFAHQSPAAPPGTSVDVKDHCSFGAACQNRKCVARHPSPAQKKAHQAEQDCKFFPNCTNPNCTFRHPEMPPCRFGSDCNRPDCKFTHVQTKCKFNPCLNPTCVYKHDEGQKRSKFGDSVWTADNAKKSHVSERKFVSNGDDDEELIKPDEIEPAEPQDNDRVADVVT